LIIFSGGSFSFENAMNLTGRELPKQSGLRNEFSFAGWSAKV